MKIQKFNSNFTIVANTWLKDTKLSARAKGIMCFLQSVDDNWSYSIKGLSTQFSEGIDAIETAVTELKNAGYLIWKQERNSQGILGKTVVELKETPYPEKPDTVKPDTVNPPQQNTNKQSKEETNTINSEEELLLLVNTKLKRNFRVLPRGIKKTLSLFTLDEMGRALDIMKSETWHKDKIGELKIDYILRDTTIDNMLNRESKDSKQWMRDLIKQAEEVDNELRNHN